MKPIGQVMQNALKDGVFPGGVLLASKKGRVVFLEAFGHARLTPERPMTIDTVFDLASLTKPLATSVAAMILIQEGKMDLDQTLGNTVRDFSDTDKKGLSVRQLLCHTSGLPDYQPYYERLLNLSPDDAKTSLRKLLVAEPLIHKPWEICLYSDLGFMILEWLIEEVAGEGLDSFIGKDLYEPLGLKNLFFNPIPQIKNRSYAATEDCPRRGKILEGEVHDDNAYAVGGVAGHAGLFGTTRAVYTLLQELLDTYLRKKNSAIFHPDTLQDFFKRQSDVGSWALGFDTPSRPDSSSGKYFSDKSVGHLGFTGTSFWMDLNKDLIVVLLTNRVHPRRDNEKIKLFRPILHDKIMEMMCK
ncbi:MAG: hypothetical protein BBJ60_01645 [Desulfobacterales bacterium S7086C20]|nr:MAG: hypothetical protein BBJ60_01645 [Desulfobacterales bacterium S7086C20]